VKKPFKNIGIVIVLLIVVVIAIRIVTKGRGEVVPSISDIQKREGVPVRIETTQKGNLSRTLQFTGTIEGEEQSVIASRLMETVKDIPVRVGQRVSRGQVVVRLDDINPQAMYRQAKATMDNAKADFERMQTLYQQGAVSKQVLDQTKLGYDVAQSNFAAARDLVELPSPVSGEVVRIHVKAGETVSPGMPVVTVAASKEVRVKFYASSEERRMVSAKQQARIYLSLSDTTWTSAIVDKVEDAADPQTRLFEITVKSDNPEGMLKPGVLTKVDVIIEERKDVLSVSKEALMTNGATTVFVVDTNNKAAKRTLTLGIRTSDRAESLTGLQAGERVVVYGQNRLTEGDPIRIIEN